MAAQAQRHAMAKAVKAAILSRLTSDVDNGGEAPMESLLRAIRQLPSNIDPTQPLALTDSLRDQLSASTMPPSTSKLAEQLLHDAIVCARIKIRTNYCSSTSSPLEALLFAVNGVADVEPSINEEMLQQVLETLVGKSPPPAKYFDDAVASWVDKLTSSNQGEEEELPTAVQVTITDDLPAKWAVAGRLIWAFDQSPPPTIVTDVVIDTFTDTIQSMSLSDQATTWALAEQLIRAFEPRPTPTMVADVFIKAFADAAEQLAAACFLSADQAAMALQAALDGSPADGKQELKKYLTLAGEKLRPPATASDEILKKVVLRVTKAIMSSKPWKTPIFAFSSSVCKPQIKESPVAIDELVDGLVFSTNLPTIIEQLRIYGGMDQERPPSHHTQLCNTEQFISFFKIDDDDLSPPPPAVTISDEDLSGDKLVAIAFTNAAEEMMEKVSRSLRPWASPRHALLAGVIDFMEKERRFPAMEAIQLLLRRDKNSPATVDEAFRKAAKAALSSITSPLFDQPVEHLLSAIEEMLSDDEEVWMKLAVYERLILSTIPIGRHHPGSKFLINGFLQAIQEWPEELPELEAIAAGVGRVRGMEEKVKEVVMGALSVAWRTYVDGADKDGYVPSNMAFLDLSLPDQLEEDTLPHKMEFKMKFRIK